jgi:hypothetical protein
MSDDVTYTSYMLSLPGAEAFGQCCFVHLFYVHVVSYIYKSRLESYFHELVTKL